MRPLMTLSTLAVLAMPLLAQADEANSAKQELEKSLKALGPLKTLKQTTAIVCECEAMIFENGMVEGGLSGTWSIASPEQLRAELQMQRNNKTESATLVISGDKTWMREPRKNETEEAPAEIAKVMRSVFRAIHVSRNPSILLGKDFKLTHLGELKINGRDTVGIRASQKGQTDVDVYFDKKTRLPVQVVMLIEAPGVNASVELKYNLQDYKKFAGRNHFTKLVVEAAGKKVMEMKLTKIELKDKLDKSTFAKP